MIDHNVSLAIFLLVFMAYFIYYNIKWLGGGFAPANLLNIFIFSFLSYPVLFSLDRANVEIYIFIFLSLGLYLYLKGRTLLSGILFAVSIAMKLFPAVFLVLFIKDKKYKEAFLIVLASILLNLISFAVLKGGFLVNIKGMLFWQNLYQTYYVIRNEGLYFGSSLFGAVKVFIYAFANLSHIFSYKTLIVENKDAFQTVIVDHASMILAVYSIFALLAFALISAFIVFKEKNTWKTAALLVFSMTLLPFVSADYKLLYIYIPLLLFIDQKQKHKFDTLYSILFGLLLIPKDYYMIARDASISVVLDPLLMVIFTGLIIFDGLKERKSPLPKTIHINIRKIMVRRNIFKSLLIFTLIAIGVLYIGHYIDRHYITEEQLNRNPVTEYDRLINEYFNENAYAIIKYVKILGKLEQVNINELNKIWRVKYTISPNNPKNVIGYALALHLSGDKERSEKVLRNSQSSKGYNAFIAPLYNLLIYERAGTPDLSTYKPTNAQGSIYTHALKGYLASKNGDTITTIKQISYIFIKNPMLFLFMAGPLLWLFKLILILLIIILIAYFLPYLKSLFLKFYNKFISITNGLQYVIKLIFILPLLLTAYSLYVILKTPGFLSSIAPNTIIYLGLFMLGIAAIAAMLQLKLQKGFLIIFLAPLLAVITGKVQALFGLLIFMTACLGLGLVLYGLFDQEEINFRKICYALFFGLAMNSYLIWIMLHFKINYSVFYCLFFICQMFASKTKLIDCLHIIKNKLINYQFTPAQYILAALMVVHMVYVLVPNYLWDELVAHFYIPKVLLLNAVFNFSPHYSPAFFNLPIISMGPDTALFLMGGEYAIRLFYWLILYISLFLFEVFTRKKYGKKISFLSTLTLASTPYFLWQIGCNYVDSIFLFSSLIIFIHFSNLLEDLNVKNITLYFIFACFALMCKHQNVFIIIPTALILSWLCLGKALKKKNISYSKTLIMGSICVLLFFTPILVHNWIITKNPTFPMYNDIFKSPFYNTEKPLPGFFKFEEVKLQWDSLYDITFHGDKYSVAGNNKYIFGISYFVFILFTPLLFFSRKKKDNILFTFFIFSTAVLLCYFITGPQLRYFTASAPPGAILIGLIMGKLLDVNSDKILRSYIIYIMIFAVFSINFACQINNSYLPSPYPIKESITGDYSKSPRLKQWQDVKKFFDEMNKRYDRSTKALLYYSPAMYFADFKIEVLDWYNQLTVMEILREPRNIEEIYSRVFKEQKFDILIITDNRPATFLDDFITKGLVRKEYSASGFSLYLPK
jgi:4-amino-4-deoxy-L-arabinose transferase-like glycosyltransferase